MLTGLFLKTWSAFACFNILVSFTSVAQIIQPDRFEIPLQKNEPAFEIAPLETNGLFLYRSLISADQRFIELVKLDTAFQQQWQGYIGHDNKFNVVSQRSYGDELVILLKPNDLRKKDFLLIRVNQNDGRYHEHFIRNYVPFVPTEFQVSGNGAVIGGYFNTVPVVLFFDFQAQKSRIVPGLFNETGELTQIKVNDNNTFDVLVSAFGKNGHRSISIKHYDPDGNLLYQLPLTTDGNKHLLFARSINTGNESQLIAGTYGNRKSEYSKGLFLASIDPDGFQQIRYYNYGDLENFFKFLKAKREQRIKDRIERRKTKGKKVQFNYRFIVHEIVPYKDQFVLLGEAFYPKYLSSEPGFSSGFFYYGARPVMQGRGRVFDGFRYTHAVVMGFDKQGKLLWDNTFEINDIKTFTLEQFVKLEMQPDRIALLYLFENQIRTKIIEENDVLEGKSFEPLRTGGAGQASPKPRNTGSSGSRMDYWYKDFFYAYGVQQFAGGSQGDRRVFFVNKVSYANDSSAVSLPD